MAFISNLRKRPVLLEDCSPDYQHSIQEKRKRQQLIAESVAAAVTLTCVSVVTIEPINQGVDGSIAGIQLTARASESVAGASKSGWESLFQDFRKPLRKGQKFLGYQVTSGFGKRRSPCPGCSNFHRGTDLATPKGVALRVPAELGGRATIRCWRDKRGGGIVADIVSQSFPEYKFQALHLSKCSSGKKKGGEIFARTGDSGTGTGPHLDLRQIHNGKYEPIAKGVVFWILQGSPPHGGIQFGDWKEKMQ